MNYILFALAVIGAYLLGSIPFGLIIARAHGKDLRSIGSGNIGATNVSRALGRKWAYVCFFLDVLKGLIPTLAAMHLARPQATYTYAEKIVTLWLWLVVGCAAVVGHIFPLHNLRRLGNGNMAGHCLDMAIRLPRLDSRLRRLPNNADRGDNNHEKLALRRPVATPRSSPFDTPDGHNPPPPEHKKTDRRNGSKNPKKGINVQYAVRCLHAAKQPRPSALLRTLVAV